MLSVSMTLSITANTLRILKQVLCLFYYLLDINCFNISGVHTNVTKGLYGVVKNDVRRQFERLTFHNQEGESNYLHMVI